MYFFTFIKYVYMYLEAKTCSFVIFANYDQHINEQHHEKTSVLHMQKTKVQISYAITAQLISPFVFDTHNIIVQSPYFLNPKYLAIFCGCIVHVQSNMVGILKTGFLMKQYE